MDGAAQAGERAAHEVWEKLARLSDMQIEPPPGKFQEQEPPSDEVPAAYSGTWLLFLSYPASSLPFMEYLTKSLSFGQKQDHRNSKPRCLLSQWRSVCSSRSEWLLKNYWKGHSLWWMQQKFLASFIYKAPACLGPYLTCLLANNQGCKNGAYLSHQEPAKSVKSWTWSTTN